MDDNHIRIRASRRTGEIEIEGPSEAVAEWFDRLWDEVNDGCAAGTPVNSAEAIGAPAPLGGGTLPDIFGEFFNEYRSDISDVDKVLIAAAFIQGKDPERAFTTKSANQLLLDQNVKVTNASQCVRRLLQNKRVFVVSNGKFRVSANGFEHLKALTVIE
jgi:hypothetical protein